MSKLSTQTFGFIKREITVQMYVSPHQLPGRHTQTSSALEQLAPPVVMQGNVIMSNISFSHILEREGGARYSNMWAQFHPPNQQMSGRRL